MLILIFKSVITSPYVEFIKLFALIAFLGSCICFVNLLRLVQVLKQYFIIRGDDEVLVLN